MPQHKLAGQPPRRQPELPVDQRQPSGDQKHREKCFEELKLCVDDIVPLATKILEAGNDAEPGREAVDMTACTVIELIVGVLENTVTTWREEF